MIKDEQTYAVKRIIGSYDTGVADERAKWVTAFRAYHKALSEPYFDQDDESRQSNRAEVQRCFDNLKALAEDV